MPYNCLTGLQPDRSKNITHKYIRQYHRTVAFQKSFEPLKQKQHKFTGNNELICFIFPIFDATTEFHGLLISD